MSERAHNGPAQEGTAAGSEARRIGRRGFIGAGLAVAGAAVVAPRPRAAAAAPAGAPPISLSPPMQDPTTQSLVAIPADRVAAAVEALDEIVAGALSATGVPGLAVSVVHGDQTLLAKGYGVRDLRTGAPVDADTVFHLASFSKSLSATVVAGLVGREQVRWQTPVAQHLPWFALADPYVTRHVTIADLFGHASGLPDHAGDLLEDLGYDRAYILRALRLEPLNPFRATYAYTNFGLTAGAAAAAAAAGSSWAAAADSILFRPLGMSASSYRHADFVRRANRAAMHVRVQGRWRQLYSRNADAEAPAGGASSSAHDLARWMALKLAGGRWQGRRVISPSALLEADTPWMVTAPLESAGARASFYGLGTNVSVDYSGRVRLGHSGAFNQGAATVYALLPDERLGIAILTNGMPIGVPEAVAAYFMDLVVSGAIQNNWLALYGELFATLYVNPSTLAGKRRPHDPGRARPVRFYTGRYDNRYYGPIEVVARGGSLQVRIGPRPTTYRLEHWSGDTFAFFPVGENALGISAARFRPAEGGLRAAALTLEYYDENGLGTFARAPASPMD